MARLTAATAIVLLLAALISYSQVTAPVKVVRVTREPISQTVEGNGTLEPQPQGDVEVTAASPMRIEDILVGPGESVRKGQLIVRLQRDPALEMEVEKAKINLDQADLNLNRAQHLYENGVIAREKFELTKTERDLAKSEYELQKRAFDYALKNSEICSPLDGEVATVDAQLGQVVDPSKPILRLVDTRDLLARLGIEIEDIGLVLKGQLAEIKLPNLPDRNPLTGRVIKMNREIDAATQLVQVWIHLDNASGRLQPGSFAVGRIVVRTDSNALVVPVSAVLKDETGPYVFVIDHEIARKRQVKTGIEAHGAVEILSGVQTGQEVAWQGNYELEEGMKVTIDKTADTAP
jgi:RND family efflux transporter MFP subunit